MKKPSALALYEENYNMLAFEPVMIEYRRKIIIENLLKYKHCRVLEIGCGNEPLFKYFSDYSLMTVIEPCASFYKNACKLKCNDNITVYNDFFENISEDLKQCNYDFIVISCLLHEIQDTDDFLLKLHEICNSETTVHISVPNASSFHRLLALEMGIIENLHESSTMNVLMNQKVFSLKTLSGMLTKHQFRIIDSGSYFIKPFTHVQMQQLLDNKIISKKLLDGLHGMTKYIPDLGSEIFINCSIQ